MSAHSIRKAVAKRVACLNFLSLSAWRWPHLRERGGKTALSSHAETSDGRKERGNGPHVQERGVQREGK